MQLEPSSCLRAFPAHSSPLRWAPAILAYDGGTPLSQPCSGPQAARRQARHALFRCRTYARVAGVQIAADERGKDESSGRLFLLKLSPP